MKNREYYANLQVAVADSILDLSDLQLEVMEKGDQFFTDPLLLHKVEQAVNDAKSVLDDFSAYIEYVKRMSPSPESEFVRE